MATKKKEPKNDEVKARQRYVDQKGQLINTTPASVRKKQAKAWKAFEDSLTEAQKKALRSKKRK